MPDQFPVLPAPFFYATAALLWLILLLLYLLRWRSYGLVARLHGKARTPAPAPRGEGLSVVIAARDQAASLERNLPLILAQRGVDFEVIVVTDVSTDETAAVVRRFCDRYSRLHTTFVPASSRYIDRTKLAITLGVRAARHEWIVLTGADCRPAGEHWLSGLAQAFSAGTDVVLGYSNYSDDGSRRARRAIYRRLRDNLRRFSAATSGRALGGDGCNLAFRKSRFLACRGFADSLTVTCGAADLLVHAIARRGHTALQPLAEYTTWQELPDPAALASRRLALTETRRHLGLRSRLMQLREGLASSLSFLFLLLSVFFITLRVLAISTARSYDAVLLPADVPFLLALPAALLLPALTLRPSLKVLGEKSFGIRPACADLVLPFSNLSYKIRRFRYRHDFRRK